MRPSGAWRPFAMSCASAGFALPANSASVSLVRLSVVLITAVLRARSTGPACGRVPSGAPGLKNWLGWKDSNLRMAGSKPAALPLGDTPAPVALTIRTPADGRRARILRRLTHPACAGEARGAGSGRGPAPRSSPSDRAPAPRSEEHTSELQSHSDLVCRLLLEKKKRQRDHTL